MHYFIDDLVWIAIALLIVAFLFMLGAAYIFLDEGIRRLVRSIRKPGRTAIPNKASQTIQANSAIPSASRNPSMSPQGPRASLVEPQQSRGGTMWHTVCSTVRESKSRTCSHLRIGHNKPANAKP